jgi:flavin-dependent dehydrogenase
MEADVVIVGAGPAGLATAIRLKQLAIEKGTELSVVVLEKGSEAGAHILSGAIMDPGALTELIPDWQAKGAPLRQQVTKDEFLFLSETGARSTPAGLLPDCFRNHGDYIVSLGEVVRWLAAQAEELGWRSSPASPLPRCCTPRTAPCAAWPRATWGWARMASLPRASSLAWNCMPGTRSSPRARAAIWADS